MVLFLMAGTIDAFGQTFGDYRSTAAVMNWSTASQWETWDGDSWEFATSYPGQTSGTGTVTISAGHTVTIDVSPENAIGSLLVSSSAILQYEPATARTLIVRDMVTINSGGTFRSASSGNVTTHQLICEGSIANNGTIDFSTNNNSAGACITFSGDGNEAFNFSDAAFTNLRAYNGLLLNKGAYPLLFTPGGTFHVQSGSTLGFLTIQSGTFSLIGTNSFSNPLFYASTGSYTIPSGGSFQLDNPNATITGMNGTLTNEGAINIRNGVYNVGNSSGNELLTTNSGSFEMSGGAMNISGRFRVDGGNCNISGGTMHLAWFGHANQSLAAFQISGAASLSISGDPLITFTYPNTNTTTHYNDIEILSGSGSKTITGGTFQMGVGSPLTDLTFLVNSNIPLHNLVVNSAHIRVSLTDNLSVNNQLTLNGQLLLNNYTLNLGPSEIQGDFRTNHGMILSGTGRINKTINTTGSYLFPYGNSSAVYLPVTLNFTAGSFTPGATVSVGMITDKHPSNVNTTNYLKRYWTVRTTGITNPVYNFNGTYANPTEDVVGDYNWMTTGVYTTSWSRLRVANVGFTLAANGLTGDADITGVNSMAAPSVTVTATPSAICSGTQVQLTANATGDGLLTYSWTPAEGLSDPGIANPVVSPTSSTPTTITYAVTVTDGMGGTASGSAQVTVSPLSSIESVSGTASICRGTSATFTANNVVLGSGTGSWSSSNTSVATINASGVVTALSEGTTNIRYTITGGCNGIVSAEQPLTVNPTVTPAVSISSSLGNTICAGSLVTFTATATGGGSNPIYQWRVNGINVGPGTPINIYETSLLTNGQVVSVVLTSNAPCATGNPTNSIAMTVIPIPSAPTAGSNTPVCLDGTINLTASTITGAAYSWTGPNGYTGTGQNISIPNATAEMAGQYSVIATVNGCSSPAGTTNVSVTLPPATPTVTVNSPVCEGQEIFLTTPTVTGAIYSCTGPNNYTSSLQNPTIANATTAAAGTYRVTISVNGCISEAGTSEVTVTPRPVISNVSNAGPACVGGTVTLSTDEIPGASYAWTGPNNFNSSERNPVLNNVSGTMGGTYSLTVTSGGCPSAPATTIVTVNPIPAAPVAGSNTPCEGGELHLTASDITGATYSWTGPNGFNSADRNPIRTGATTAMAGVYSVTATVAGCTSAASTINVVVNSIPSTPTITTNSPVCVGGTINLTTPTVAGATYSWTGPNGFNSQLQNPTIANATTAMAGTYSVIITVGGCASAAGTTNVVVNSIPSTPTITTNSPVCAGSTITLSTPTVAGATYSWTGPNGFNSQLQNPTIANATTANAGTYYVTVTVGGCTSAQGSVQVIVNAAVTPSVTISATSQAICSTAGTPVTFTASPTNEGTAPTYQWRNNGTPIAGATGSTYTVSSLPNPSVISVVMTSNATCASPTTATSNTITMTVYTSAPTTTTGNNANSKPSSQQSTSICPPASNLVYTIPVNMTQNAALYTWQLPPGFNITSGAGTRQITVSVPGPGSNVGSQDIRVMATNPCGSSDWSSGLTINVGTFAAVNAGSNFSMCLGTSATLTNVLSGNATSVTWAILSGNGTISGGPYPAPFSFTPSSTGQVTLRATTNTPTGSGCPNVPGTAQITITVNQPSVAPSTLNVSRSAVCLGLPVTLTQAGGSLGTGATWHWYSNNTYTNQVGTSTSADASLTITPTATTTYYLRAESTTGAPCAANVAGPSAGVTVTVSQPSIAPATLNASPSPVCSGSPVTLTQAGGSLGTGAAWKWYSDATYTTFVGDGTGANASLTVSPTTNTTYYLRIEGGTAPCSTTVTGPAAGVSVTVNQPSVAPATLNVSQSAVCLGLPVTLTQAGGSLGTGATWHWYSNNTYTNQVGSSTSADASLTITPTATTTYYLRAESTTGAPCAANVAGPSAGVTVTVSQPVLITTQPNPSQSVCAGFPVILTVSASGTGLTYAWYRDSNPINVTTPTLNISNAAISDAGTYTVVVSGAGGCSSVTSDPAVLIVSRDIDITQQPQPLTLCESSTVQFTVAATGNITNYIWRKGGTPLFDGGNISGAETATLTIANILPATAGSYDVVISGPDGACGQTISNPALLTVNANSTIALTSASGTDAQNRCINTSITDITYQLGGGATGATISGQPAGVTGVYNAITKIFTISGAPTVSGSYSYIVTTTGPCINPSLSGIIAVSENAALVLTSTNSTTSQTICVNSALTDITYAIGGSGTGASINAGALPAGVTGTYNAGVFTISGIPTVSGTFNYTVSTSGSCSNVSLTGSITVNANSSIVLSSAAGTDAQTRCVDTAITNITYQLGGGATGATVTGLPSGVSGSYNGGIFTISGTPSVVNTYNYTVTTLGPCINNSISGTISVNPNATITLTSAARTTSQTVCVNNTIENITYTMGGITGATVTGLPSGVSGAYNEGTFTISGTPTVAGTYNYTISTTGPCNNPTVSGSITVNANSTIALSSAAGTDAQTRCINMAITNITYILGGSATGATVTGLPLGVSGVYNSTTKILTISGTPTVSGIFNYNVTPTGPCINNSLGGTITIDPSSVGGTLAPEMQVVCAGSSPGPITLSGNNGDRISWEISTDGGNSWSSVGNANSATYLPGAGQTATYRAIVQSGTCTTARSTYALVVIVNPYTPTITSNPSPPAICIGQSATLTASSGTMDGPFIGTYSNANPTGWRVNGSDNNFPSAPANEQPGDWGRATNDRTYYGTNYYSNGGAFSVVNGPITSTMETPVFSLLGMSSAFFNIAQALRLANGASARIEISTDGGNTYNTTLASYTGPTSTGSNAGLSPLDISLMSYLGQTSLRLRLSFVGRVNSTWAVDDVFISATPGGSPYTGLVTYQWSPATGLNTTSGPSVIATPLITTVYTVITTLTNGNVTCPLGTAQVTVTVNDLPTITLGPNPSVCRGITSANLTYNTTTGSPNQYSVVYDAAAIAAGFVNRTNVALPTGQIALTVPAAAAVGTYNATLTVRNSTTGCVSAAYPISVTINALPTITLGTNPAVCLGATTASLTYSAATGSPDLYSIDYDAAAQTAGFVDVTNAALSASPIGLVVPATAMAGTYNGTLTVSNSATTCASLVYPISVTVNPIPVCNITGSSTAYAGSTTNVYTSNVVPPDVVTHAWTISGNGTITGLTTGASVNVAATTPGTFTLTDNITRLTCTSSCTITVTIVDLPCSITPNTSVTTGATTVYNAPTDMDTYTWTVTGNATVPSGNYNQQTLSVLAGNNCNTYTVQLTMTKNGATTTCSEIITVTDNQNPVVTCPTAPTGLCANSTGTYSYSGTGWDATATDNCGTVASLTYVLTGVTTGTGTTLNGVEFQSGSTIVTWTARDAAGNQGTCSYTITVHPLPLTSAIYHN